MPPPSRQLCCLPPYKVLPLRHLRRLSLRRLRRLRSRRGRRPLAILLRLRRRLRVRLRRRQRLLRRRLVPCKGVRGHHQLAAQVAVRLGGLVQQHLRHDAKHTHVRYELLTLNMNPKHHKQRRTQRPCLRTSTGM